MKTLNRILLLLVIGYSVFTAVLYYKVIFGSMAFYGGQWKLVWNDEFNGSALDLTRWTPVIRSSSPNGELQAYVDENVTVQNGCLIITCKKEDWTGPDNFHPGRAITRHYTSGCVETKGKSAWAYGRFEIRAKFPEGRGLLSFSVLHPIDGTWPPEIKIVEIKGDTPQTIGMFNFWGTHPKIRFDYLQKDLGPVYSAGFHIFALEWEPKSLHWYVDGIEQFQTHQYVPDQSLSLNLGTSVGGVFGGSPDGEIAQGRTNSFPKYLEVDWIRIYQRR